MVKVYAISIIINVSYRILSGPARFSDSYLLIDEDNYNHEFI